VPGREFSAAGDGPDESRGRGSAQDDFVEVHDLAHPHAVADQREDRNHVRFTSNGGQTRAVLECPLSAKRQHRLARVLVFYPGLNAAERRELAVHVGVI